ncbi:MAG TPA: acetyl-CoA C-acyltransferase [Gemmatimonadaceae bacterium]|nr:acetyl-CoA C-acyltransferase [Gemmatimonadaceae bacterium]
MTNESRKRDAGSRTRGTAAPGAVIVDALRTPIGRHGGALARVRPDDLAAVVIRALLERTGVEPGSVDDVILGCANQAGEDNRNVARMALLLAGMPVSVPGQTVNRLCGSGLQAVVSAAQAVRAGEGECFVAGGVESMSRAPWVTLKPEEGFTRAAPQVADTTVGWRFVNSRLPKKWTISLGETAEEVARRCAISREEQDAFALESQRRAARAMAENRFADELVPVEVEGRKGERTRVERDEHPRPDVTIEKLASMRPAFVRDGGTVTAGSSSGINDGASVALVMSEDAARRAGLRPMARIVASAVAGVSPEIMGMGPVPAARKALERAGLGVDDMNLIELNEAFASQSIACMRELGADPAKVNVNGGAIALGHPLGASGARVLTTLVHELGRRGERYGLATMCIGVGQGIATIVERVA